MASEPRFFVLRKDFEGLYDTDTGRADDTEVGDAPRCPKCGGDIGMLEWLPPFRIEIDLYGKEGAGDFAETTSNGVLLSARMVAAIRAVGLTGLHGFHSV